MPRLPERRHLGGSARGVVLIGDAAGHNDPTIDQGLSITLRDVRLVAEALSRTPEWDDQLFVAYAAERRERMRRLRFDARLTAMLRCEFNDQARLRRDKLRGGWRITRVQACC